MRITVIAVILLLGVACNTSPSIKEMDAQAYLKTGDSIVKNTFDTLRNTLARTIAEKGLPGAIRFCNEQAIPLTSSYSAEGKTVSRVTDKTRNPENALSETDKAIWEKYIKAMAKKDSLQSTVTSKNGEIHYYKPIIIQPMCLNCHGAPGKELTHATMKVIDSLYPADQAKGYKTGDLRGMWHIVFTKKDAKL